MMGVVIRSFPSICWLVYAEGQNVVLLKQIDHLSGAHRNTSDKTF